MPQCPSAVIHYNLKEIMTRTIRPIGPVTATLKKAGYRQYAAIFVDGKQVERASVLSTLVGTDVRFVGYYIDSNGEVHKTKPMNDMKRAAGRALAMHRADDNLIDCQGCGTRHSDDDMCPED
jgi:hypothetical protein